MKKRPRAYQIEALEALNSARAKGETSALLVMASGLGKTLTAVFDVKEYYALNPEGRTLVLCHSSFILEQAKDVFAEELGSDYTYELYDGTIGRPQRANFVFANLHSVFLHKEELFERDEFDYIIVDEAHHSTARTYRAAIEYFRPKFLLGLTATPDRKDGQSIENIFGEPAYSLDLIEAIDRGLLAGIDYYIEIDQHIQRQLLSKTDNLDYADLDKLLQSNFLSDEEAIKAILRHQQEMGNPTTAIFCQDVAHAEAVKKLMPEAGIVHSYRTNEENAQALAQFKSGELRTIISVNMLNEGVDVPRIDLVVFLRMTMSSVVFLQQLGRGLRPVEGKDKVRVLDFVCIAARLEELFEIKERFKAVKTPAETVIADANENPMATADVETVDKGEPKGANFSLGLNGNSYADWCKEDILTCIKRAMERRAIMRWSMVPDEELLELLRQAQKLIGVEELTSKQYSAFAKAHPMFPSLKTYQDRFGSWYEAAKRAGFKVTQQRGWSDEDLLELLRKIYQSLGESESLSMTKYERIAKEKGYPSASLFGFRFGSWNKALELADVNLDVGQASWKMVPDRELLEILRRVYDSLDCKILSRRRYDDAVGGKAGYPSSRVFVARFGSWNGALELAGLATSKRGCRWEMPEAEVLTLLREAQARVGGNVMSMAAYDELAASDNRYPSSSTIMKLSDMSWSDIMKRAGLKTGAARKSWRDVSDDRMLELVHEVYLLNGARKLTKRRYAELTKGKAYPGLVVLSGRFGSWNEMLRRLGLKINRC